MNLSEGSGGPQQIEKLVESLASDNAGSRTQARKELISLGGADVTRALVGELVDPRQHVRWEAAKALAELADPVAAPALVHMLEDEDGDVRWVAAEALIALRQPGLLAVLSGLTRRARSIEFCKSAHHVLHDLRKHKFADVIAPVLRALESSEPEVTAPPAAYNALANLKQGGDGG